MKRVLYILFLVLVVWAGFTLGRSTGGDLVVDAERDLMTDFPMPPPPPDDAAMVEVAGDAAQGKMVIVETPVRGAEVTDPLTVAGRADASFKKVLITLKSGNGEQLLYDEEVPVTGGSGDVFGRFETDIDVSEFGEGDIQVIVLGITKEGIEERDIRTVSIVRPNAVAVKVYFTNPNLSAENGTTDICENVHAVTRSVSSRTAIYRSVIEELAKGPTADERDEGYATSLPKNVVLRSIAADADGVVTADFTSSLDRGVAGSCRVLSIRTQIEQTLRQFPEVRGVVISVDGDAEEALQP